MRAADDVAALSISTSLKSAVTTLRQSLNNALQAGSYLQVADAALANIDDMLQRMAALSVQSGSGTLTSTERGFLNQEFRNLYDEIDRIAENTNFNGLAVLQQEYGDLLQGVSVVNEVAEASYGTLTFNGNVGAGQTIILNQVTLTEGIDFNRAGTVNQTVQNLADALNSHSSLRIQQANYTAIGNTLQITHKAAGAYGDIYTIDEQTSSARLNYSTFGQNVLGGTDRYTLLGGVDGTTYMGSVTASGSSANSLITGQNQTLSTATYFFDSATNVSDGDFFRIDNGVAANVVFTFRGTPNPADPLEVQIGTTSEESARNLTVALNNYLNTNPSSDNIHGIRQVDFFRDEDQIVIRTKVVGIPFDFTGTNPVADPLDIGESGIGITIVTPNQIIPPFDLSSGSDTGGVHTTGVTNADFLGTISGFNARFSSEDRVIASVTVGEHTYTATIADTTPNSNAVVQFNSSTGGGYFQIELGGFQGLNVTGQADADTFAEMLDEAFSGMTFYQQQELDYLRDDTLRNTRMFATLDDFSNIIVEDVQVTTSQDGNSANMSFVINGETYTSQYRIGREIGAFESFEFINEFDNDKIITFVTEGTSFDLTREDVAEDLAASLRNALAPEETHINDALISRSFQVGITSEQSIDITLNYVSTDVMFEDTSVNILSEANASAAYDAVQVAIDYITSTRAQVGSLQKRFDFAVDNINDAILSQDNARGVLEDTDIAAESTAFAQYTVKLNASISLIAQSNSLRTSLITTLLNG